LAPRTSRTADQGPKNPPFSLNLLPRQSHSWNQDGGRDMRFKPGIALGVLGPAVGLVAFVSALQLQVSAMPAVRGIDPASIDRTLKNDRLPVGPQVVRPSQYSEQPRLPEGCVEASDWYRKVYNTEIAGRCVG
jgi:hypothetical protein